MMDAMEVRGSQASLDAAIDAYYDEIRTAMRKRGLSQTQATEIVHDLYVRLSGNPQPLGKVRSIRAFLIRAAINLGIDRARRATFEKRLFAALDAGASVTGDFDYQTIERGIDLPRRLAFLRDAILELPPQCRNVFLAHRLARMSKPEIAEALGIQRRMVDRHLRNALLHCLERLDEFDNR